MDDIKNTNHLNHIIKLKKFEKNFYIGFTLSLSGGWFYKKDNSDKLIHRIHPEMFSKDEISF